MLNQSIELPLPLPEALRPWLTLNSAFHVIACHVTGCQQALSPDGISNHLSRKHQVNLKSRQQLTEYLKQWQWPYDFRSVPLPLNGSLPQPVLPVIDGFQCRDCIYTTTNRLVIRQHCNTEHQKQRLSDEELFQAIQLQAWFRGNRARYWVVDATRQSRGVNNGNGNGNEDGDGNGSGSSSDDAGAAIKAEITEWIAKEEGQYQVSTVAAETDPWLRYTGWEEVLAASKHDLATTTAFTATASATEPALTQAIQSWERILQRSLTTLMAVGNYKDILKWWASPKNEVASQQPFERPELKTITRYSQTFARLLCYVMRTAPEHLADETITGVTFSELQLTHIMNLRGAVAVAEAGAEDTTELDTAVMGVIITLLTQDTSQLLLYESPVMHYLAIRSVNPQTQRFYPSFQYTPAYLSPDDLDNPADDTGGGSL